jgi:hypothetical protein
MGVGMQNLLHSLCFGRPIVGTIKGGVRLEATVRNVWERRAVLICSQDIFLRSFCVISSPSSRYAIVQPPVQFICRQFHRIPSLYLQLSLEMPVSPTMPPNKPLRKNHVAESVDYILNP